MCVYHINTVYSLTCRLTSPSLQCWTVKRQMNWSREEIGLYKLRRPILGWSACRQTLRVGDTASGH